MFKRVVVGLLVGAAWLSVFLFAPGWVLFALLAAGVAACQWEFYTMFRRGATKADCGLGWGIALGFIWELYSFLAPAGSGYEPHALSVLAALLLVFFARVLFLPQSRRPLQYAGITLLGFFYLPFMLAYFIKLVQLGVTAPGAISPDRTGVYLALYIATVVKFNDVGGFAFGIPFGRHKLMPSVSPKKSWEGLFGGFLFATLFSWLFVWLARIFPSLPLAPLREMGWGMAAVVAVALGVLGMLGDLVESRFKRVADVKDSAALLPAGGILDMFDSLVFVPFAFYMLLLFA